MNVCSRNRLAIAFLAAALPAAAQPETAANDAALEAAWRTLAAKDLPLVQELAATDACGNQAAVSAHVAEVRAAAGQYFSAKGKELQSSYEGTARELDFLRKSSFQIHAQRGDLPALIKTQEAALADYRAVLSGLPAQDRENRLLYQKLVERTEASLATLRTALADANALDQVMQVSLEVLGAQAEGTKRYQQLLDTERQATDLNYDAILERQQMACLDRAKPQRLDRLNQLADAGAGPLSGLWTYNSRDQRKPGKLNLQLKESSAGIEGVITASALVGIPALTFSGPRRQPMIFPWSARGQTGSIELIPAGQMLEMVWKTEKNVVLFDDLLTKTESIAANTNLR